MEEKECSNERGKLERAGKKGNQCISKGNMGEMEKENTFIKKTYFAAAIFCFWFFKNIENRGPGLTTVATLCAHI